MSGFTSGAGGQLAALEVAEVLLLFTWSIREVPTPAAPLKLPLPVKAVVGGMAGRQEKMYKKQKGWKHSLAHVKWAGDNFRRTSESISRD